MTNFETLLSLGLDVRFYLVWVERKFVVDIQKISLMKHRTNKESSLFIDIHIRYQNGDLACPAFQRTPRWPPADQGPGTLPEQVTSFERH